MNRGLSTTVRLGEVDTVEYQRDRGVGVTVYFGKRKGSASTADLSAKAVRETVEKACTIARYTAEDDVRGSCGSRRARARHSRTSICDHPWDADARMTAVELARVVRGGRARGRCAHHQFRRRHRSSTQRDVRVYGNSHGFLEGFASTSHSLSCVLLAQQGEDMQRDYWYTTARDAHGSAGGRSDRAQGRRARAARGWAAAQLTTRKAPVLFAPELARGLLRAFLGAIRGGAQYRKSSFLLDAAGQQVLPSFLQIEERPHILQGAREQPVR